jgi:acetyl esterase/lipase
MGESRSGRRGVVLLCAAACLAVLALPGAAARTWRLGGRIVPGPIPPDPFAPSPKLDLQSDIIYGIAGGEALRLDLARPVLCRGQTLPLVVYIHGGGWMSGDKSEALDNRAAALAFQLGFAVASVDYRLAPRYRFPDQVHDVKLAVRHLRKNAESYGIDPDRIAAAGGSAGGHLSALLGTSDAGDGLEGPGLPGVSSRVTAVVDFFGPTDLADVDTPVTAEGLNLVLGFLGCHPLDCPVTARAASPISFVTPDDPPVLIVHGDHDVLVPYRQAEVFAERLRLAGVGCALVKVANADHGFAPNPAGATISPGLFQIAWLAIAHLARYLEPALLGDLDMDGRRNSSDLRSLFAALGTVGVGPSAVPAPPAWNPLADINPDGRIDSRDVEAFLRIK